MALHHAQRTVFFDLDGTLHQEDLFGRFLRYLLRCLPLNLPLVICLLPVVTLGLIIQGRTARWPMSLLLWSMTFGRSERHLQQLEKDFTRQFRADVTPFPLVQQRLTDYLLDGADVWLVTGSPLILVDQVYGETPWLSQVKMIGSEMSRAFGGRVLTLRCLSGEKVIQLEKHLGKPLKLYSGYSDSLLDDVVLQFCQHRFRVTADGQLQTLK